MVKVPNNLLSLLSEEKYVCLRHVALQLHAYFRSNFLYEAAFLEIIIDLVPCYTYS